ncbi:MAG: ATP-binding protein [Magnetospiraceae bacterium]
MDDIEGGDVIRRLAFENAWWPLKPDQPHRFKEPVKRSHFDLFIKAAEDAPPGRAHILAGPRRTGKSVMLRQAIVRRIQDGVLPNRILYASLSNPVYWSMTVADLVALFQAHHGHGADDPLHIFLDEIQYMRNWQEGLAEAAARWPECRFIASASAGISLGMIAGHEESPFTTTLLPPLTFAEFLRIRGGEAAIFDGAGGQQLHSSKVPVLNDEFVRYVNYGGFPEGIMTRAEGTPPPSFIRDSLVDRLLHKDLAPLYGVNDPWELNRLIAVLARHTAAEVSIEGLSRLTGVAKNTVRKYLDFLESAYLIHRVYRVNDAARFYRRAVTFKVYLTTTTLYAALFGPVSASDPVFPRLAETALLGQLLGSPTTGRLAYAGWRGGKVDLVAMDAANRTPWLVVEMDWDERLITSSQGPKAVGYFVGANCPRANIFVLTRQAARPATLQGYTVRIVPAALACYLTRHDLLGGLFEGYQDKLSDVA